MNEIPLITVHIDIPKSIHAMLTAASPLHKTTGIARNWYTKLVNYLKEWHLLLKNNYNSSVIFNAIQQLFSSYDFVSMWDLLFIATLNLKIMHTTSCAILNFKSPFETLETHPTTNIMPTHKHQDPTSHWLAQTAESWFRNSCLNKVLPTQGNRDHKWQSQSPLSWIVERIVS